MIRSEEKNILDVNRQKPDFPPWVALLSKLAKIYCESRSISKMEVQATIEGHLQLIGELKEVIHASREGFHPAIAYELICHACCAESEVRITPELMDTIKKVSIQGNTFYTIFDTTKKAFTNTDERIRRILGFTPEQFSLEALLGFDPTNQMFHPVDMAHSIRLGAFAYLALSIPGLEMKAMEDYFRASYRIGVRASQIEEVRKLEYVKLEKSVFMLEPRKRKDPLPSQFLYKISVFSEDDFHGINPYFVSDPIRSGYMNAFHYLFHAQLLGIGTKFLLLLHERSTIDRNKAIANSINEKLKKYSRSEIELDEGRVADCFAKTIRPKIAEAINVWENRTEKVVIASDQEAVLYAKTLGLLPVPKLVLELIYQHMDAS